ncbi:MAG: ABC transporter permease, partial [Betaproteobacteria bacterium]|nr:ABC transporter permease [Betaproteobacteria bacterium]
MSTQIQASQPAPMNVSLVEQVRRERRRRQTLILTAQVLLAIGILIFWEWAAGPRNTPGILIDEFYISRPSLIWDALGRWVAE